MVDISKHNSQLIVNKVNQRIFNARQRWPSASVALTHTYIKAAKKITGISAMSYPESLTLEKILLSEKADEITCLEAFALFLDYINIETLKKANNRGTIKEAY